MTERDQNKIKAEQEMHRRRIPTHRWHNIPPVYDDYFYWYLIWVLARMPPPNGTSIKQLPFSAKGRDPRYERLSARFREPVSLSEVEDFLEKLLGEQLEATLDRKANVRDYRYVADELHEGTAALMLIPATVVRAQEWLEQQIAHCRKTAGESTSTNAATSEEDVADTVTDEGSGSSVDDTASQAGAPWGGLLNNYSLAELNKLLLFVGLLETIDPLTISEKARPAEWVALIAALEKKKKVKRNRAKLYAAFTATYGDICSLSSFSRSYNESNPDACTCYDRAMSRIN